jgi:hypothetical protein
LLVNPDEILGHVTIGEPLLELAAAARKGESLLFAYLGKIDLADYLHRDRSSIIGCSDLDFFHDTSTLESSQRFNYSLVESASIFGRRIGLPKPSADPDF